MQNRSGEKKERKKSSLRIDRKSHIYGLVGRIWQETKRKRDCAFYAAKFTSQAIAFASLVLWQVTVVFRFEMSFFSAHNFINMKISFFSVCCLEPVCVLIDKASEYRSFRIFYLLQYRMWVCNTQHYTTLFQKKTRLMLQRKRTARLWLSTEELEFCCCSTQFNSLKWVVWMKAAGGEREIQTRYSIVHETILKIPMLCYTRGKRTATATMDCPNVCTCSGCALCDGCVFCLVSSIFQ